MKKEEIKFKVINDWDLELHNNSKDLTDLDVFDWRAIFHKKEEGFRPSAYANKLKGSIESAQNVKPVITPNLNV